MERMILSGQLADPACAGALEQQLDHVALALEVISGRERIEGPSCGLLVAVFGIR